MAEIKNTTSGVSKNVEQPGISNITGENVKLFKHFENRPGNVS